MIENFEALKKQLQELSSVINSFKSESVQLRIVELIFQGSDDQTSEVAPSSRSTPRRRSRTAKKASKRKVKAGEKPKKAASKKPPVMGKKGPATILGELVEEDFFKSNRTINDIVEYVDAHKARKLKSNEYSGTLARFVRDKRLKRQKNSDGQYEYFS